MDSIFKGGMIKRWWLMGMLVGCLGMCLQRGYAQQLGRLTQYEQALKDMALESPGLSQPVSLSVSGASIQEFLRALAEAANLNINVAPGLETHITNNFQSEKAMNILLFLAKEYSLSLSFTGSIISVGALDPASLPRQAKPIRAAYKKEGNLLSLTLENDSLVAAARAITQQSGINVVVTNELKDKLVSLFVQDLDLAEALKQLAFTNQLKLAGTAGGSFVFLPLAQNEENYINPDHELDTRRQGEEPQKKREVNLIKLQNRSIDTIQTMIPASWRQGVEIKEFREQNTLLLSGPDKEVQEISALIRQLDTRVPMVLIEVTMLDIRKGYAIKTGITAGVSDSVKTGGTLLSGLDYTFGARSINNLLSKIGTGAFNLGRVTPNFYVSLSAMEDNNNVELRSVPKLSTLNGHVASMSIGNKRYYRLSTQNVMGSFNPQTVVTEQFNSVDADMTIKIKPLVSGDEQVTLNIDINISDFTQDTPLDQPPPTTSSKFTSIIRVGNEETVVLGGIERYESTDNSSGLPGISRVPVLKWLFSSRSKGRKKVVSVVFIKPTIIYQ